MKFPVKTVLDYMEENSFYSKEKLNKIHNKRKGDRVISQFFVDCCSDFLKEIIWSDAYDDTCYMMKDFRVDKEGRVSFYHTNWQRRTHIGAHLEDVIEKFCDD